MSRLEGLSGGADRRSEASIDPEVSDMLEFLRIFQEIQQILTWLIEASANTDLSVKVLKRARLQILIQQLGLDPESPDTFVQLEAIKAEFVNRTIRPQPKFEIPDVGFFESRIDELISQQNRYGNPAAHGFAVDRGTDLADVAQYAHTDWASVRSRTDGGRVGKWIHGVAMIMADPIAYQTRFGGLGVDANHNATDHLTVAPDWSVLNGRHRSLAARSLGEEYIREGGMSQWVPVVVEQP